VVVDIAGFPVLLNASDEPLALLLRERYRHFLTPSADPAARLDLTVVPTPPRDDTPDLAVHHEGERWRMSRGDFVAEWNGATRHGFIRQTCNPFSTDSVLRIVHSIELCSEAGFLLHASSVVIDGCAYLFTGPSGAGKTTIAQLAPPEAILLTDEISCVRRTARGWTAFGTPFAGELGTSGRRVSAPITALYRLEQGKTNRIEPLTPGEAVRTLMRNILFFARDAAREQRILDTVCQLIAMVPIARLTFTREAGVWTTIRQAH
jgi:hypothetical protein